MNHTRLSAPLLAAALLLAGCSTPLSSPSDAKAPTATEVLGQSALPPGSSLKPEQSFIMGAGEQWLGRAVADVGRDTEAAFRFFLEAYPAQGWTVVSSVRGKNSFVVMTRQERTATLEMVDGGMLVASTVSITMAPRNAPFVVPKKP